MNCHIFRRTFVSTTTVTIKRSEGIQDSDIPERPSVILRRLFIGSHNVFPSLVPGLPLLVGVSLFLWCSGNKILQIIQFHFNDFFFAYTSRKVQFLCYIDEDECTKLDSTSNGF